jgi:DNA-binding NarL/FixJ family response regulator
MMVTDATAEAKLDNLGQAQARFQINLLRQASTADMAQAALSLGARGYVVKAEAKRDLLASVEAVVSEGTFVRRIQANYRFTVPLEAQSRCRARHRTHSPAR